MTDKQENFRTMCLAVQDVCNDNNPTWNTNVPFSNNFTIFGTLLGNLETQRILQGTPLGGIKMDKEQLEGIMITDALKIAAAIKSLAADTNNNTLYEEVNFTKTDLERDRDTVKIDKCLIIVNKANDNIGSLGPYNVLAGDVGVLSADIVNYNNQLPKPRAGIVGKKSATDQIKIIIGDLRTHLEKKLDNNVETFKGTSFYNDYKNAREIPDTGAIDTGIELTAIDSGTGAPLKGVLAEVLTIGSKKRTNVKGVSRFKRLSEAPNYSVQLKKKGYQIATSTGIAVTKDNLTKVTVSLQKLP